MPRRNSSRNGSGTRRSRREGDASDRSPQGRAHQRGRVQNPGARCRVNGREAGAQNAEGANAMTSQGMFRTGWLLSGFVGLFLLVDGGARLAGFGPYVAGMTTFGYTASLAPPVGFA